MNEFYLFLFQFIYFYKITGTTFGYVAPELKGSIQKFDKTCDIYAMGISMDEILSNKSSPWDELNLPNEISKLKIESGMRPDLQTLMSLYEDSTLTLDSALEVIKTCWAEDNRPEPSQVRFSFTILFILQKTTIFFFLAIYCHFS